MKLDALLEDNSPTLLRRSALKLQQELAERDWDSKIKFTVSNTGVQCAILNCTRGKQVMQPSPVIYYVGPDSFHNTDSNKREFVRWEDPVNGRGHSSMEPVLMSLDTKYGVAELTEALDKGVNLKLQQALIDLLPDEIETRITRDKILDNKFTWKVELIKGNEHVTVSLSAGHNYELTDRQDTSYYRTATKLSDILSLIHRRLGYAVRVDYWKELKAKAEQLDKELKHD